MDSEYYEGKRGEPSYRARSEGGSIVYEKLLDAEGKTWQQVHASEAPQELKSRVLHRTTPGSGVLKEIREGGLQT